jgi:hypothetical protein
MFVSSSIQGQSRCLFVLLGSTEESEQIRVHSSFQAELRESGRLITSLNNFQPDNLNLEIKGHNSKKFQNVKLKIPKPYGCNLLLVRDLKLKPPFYFRAEWLSQEMTEEYLFPPPSNGFDTALFDKAYKTAISPPKIKITYKNQPFTAELIRSINPFNGQNLELIMDIVSANDTRLQAKFKAVEISFSHPNITRLEPKYIVSNPTNTLPQDDSRFYWPNDFTMIPDAKITFKFLYWYVDGYEIIESGMTTQTIEF